jgi:hypothetical protein
MGEASCDKVSSGRPGTATDKSHQEHIEEMIRKNGQIKQKGIVLKLEISKIVGHIINYLGF